MKYCLVKHTGTFTVFVDLHNQSQLMLTFLCYVLIKVYLHLELFPSRHCQERVLRTLWRTTAQSVLGYEGIIVLQQVMWTFSAVLANHKDQKTNSVALSPRANYNNWATATCRRNLVPTFVDRGVSRGQRGGSPTVVNLSFLDRNRYFSSK
jgi:hypothetical protein